MRATDNIPRSMQATYAAIVTLTDAVCLRHLDDEYAALARSLTAALARKRPSPLQRGKAEAWACGILYALGTVNFLFDKSQTPHMSADELCAAFGMSKSGGASKAKLIRDLFGMDQGDPRWYRPSHLLENPYAWLIQVNGLVVDARYLPRQVQEEAYAKGLIPFVPESTAKK